MTAPRTHVVPVPAAPPRVGLIASARALNRAEESVDGDARWEGGFDWQPEQFCEGGIVVDPCAGTSKAAEAGPSTREYDPVGLVAHDTCSTFDRGRDRQGRVRRMLNACQSKLLAGELWNGTVAQAAGFNNAFLADAAGANTLTNGAVDPTDALACLEQGLAAASCSQGMIHCTPATMTHWNRLGLVARQANVFLTANDTLVVADAGYDGTGPGGLPAVDGSVWAYGTDVVHVRLGGIEIVGPSPVDNVDRETNLEVWRAERLAAATWDGCAHVAVEIDHSVCADPAAS